MNGFLFCLLTLVAVQVPQDNAGDLGWDIVDGELAVIVHVHPIGVEALKELNTIENEIPDFLRGRATSINIRFSSDPPPRNPSRAEIEQIPLVRRTVPMRNLMDMGQGSIATIDPEKNIDNNPIVATSATNFDPQLDTRSRDDLRTRDEGAPPPLVNGNSGASHALPNTFNNNNLLGNPAGGNLTRNDLGTIPNRQPMQPIQQNPTSIADQQNSNAFNAYPGQSGLPVGQMSSLQQPVFMAAMPNPTGNSYLPSVGQNNMLRGVDNSLSDPRSLPVGGWQRTPPSSAYDQRLAQTPSPIPPQNRAFLGASDTTTNQSQVGWIMFIISLVFNVYMFFYLFKLRERYRSLLTSVRTGVDSGY